MAGGPFGGIVGVTWRGTVFAAGDLSQHAAKTSQPCPPAVGARLQDLSCLRPPVHLAQEVGAGLGEREVLLGPMPEFGGEVS